MALVTSSPLRSLLFACLGLGLFTSNEALFVFAAPAAATTNRSAVEHSQFGAENSFISPLAPQMEQGRSSARGKGKKHGKDGRRPQDWHSEYHNYEEIQEYIASLAARYPDRAKVISLGTTYENRSISALQLTLPPPPPPPPFSLSASLRQLIRRVSAGEATTVSHPMPREAEEGKKLGMLVSAESHAREWISAASAVYFAEEVLQQAALFPDPTPPPPPPPEDPEPVPEPSPEPEPPAPPGRHHSMSTDLQQWVFSGLFRGWAGFVSSRTEGSDSATTRRAHKSHHHGRSGHRKGKSGRGGSGGKRRKHGRHRGDEHDHINAPALTPQEAHEMLQRYRVTIVPLSNPDGYAYTWLNKGAAGPGSRLWRKNRQPAAAGAEGKKRECIGIDVNRNWDYQFPDSRDEPEWQREMERCSESFAGDQPFEALETAAVARFLTDEEENVKVFIDLHSYGQNVMYPFATSCEEPLPDEEDLIEVALGSVKALRSQHESQFSTGKICDLLFPSWGTSIDWSYGRAGIKWSFAIELRDAGTHGFLLPPNQIRPSGEELTSLVGYMSGFIAKKEK